MSNRTLFLYFTSLTGAVIAGIVWLYLKVANVGITVIWEMVPAYIDSKYYTVLMCLGGGVLIGLFHRVYGPYPERMADSVKRVKDTGTYPYRKLPMIVSASFLSSVFRRSCRTGIRSGQSFTWSLLLGNGSVWAGTLEDGDADRRKSIYQEERIVPGDGSWAVSSAGSDCVRQREDRAGNGKSRLHPVLRPD